MTKHRPAPRRSAYPPDYPKDPKDIPAALLKWQREMNVGRAYKGKPDDFKHWVITKRN